MPSDLNQPPASMQPPRRRGVVAVIVRQEQLLVIRRSALVAAPRAICFPGGGIEGQESEAAALIRELGEELNVAVTPTRRLWHSTTAWNVELSWWLAHLPDEARLLPNPQEVEDVFWLRPQELQALDDLLDSNRQFLAALDRGEVSLHGH